jgi:hypothetical protein
MIRDVYQHIEVMHDFPRPILKNSGKTNGYPAVTDTPGPGGAGTVPAAGADNIIVCNVPHFCDTLSRAGICRVTFLVNTWITQR